MMSYPFVYCLVLVNISCCVVCHCRSPGYGLTLVSESTTGVLHSAELFSNQPLGQGSGGGQGSEERPPPSLPEDIGRQTALLLIQEIVKVCLCITNSTDWLVTHVASLQWWVLLV